MTAYGFYLGQPWWLAAGLVIVPMIWLARRNLAALGAGRRTAAIVLRAAGGPDPGRPVGPADAGPERTARATVIAVLDRSQSIPTPLGEAALDYLSQAVTAGRGANQLAVVDVAEAASISKLPSGDTTIRRRNTTLTGQQSRLADGVQMAMAIAPPDTATRIVLAQRRQRDGRGPEGGGPDRGGQRDSHRRAAAASIATTSEVLFKRLVAPPRARSGQTISLRFVLNSTADVRGKLLLTLNGQPVDLVPDSPEVAVPVELKAGDQRQDGLHSRRHAGHPQLRGGLPAGRSEAGPDRREQPRQRDDLRGRAGPRLVVDTDDTAAQTLLQALRGTDMGIARYAATSPSLPDELPRLLDTDAIVLANVECTSFTLAAAGDAVPVRQRSGRRAGHDRRARTPSGPAAGSARRWPRFCRSIWTRRRRSSCPRGAGSDHARLRDARRQLLGQEGRGGGRPAR